jgi:signal peptidase I
VRAVVTGAAIAVVLVAGGCSGRHAATGSIPVKTIARPSGTETYSVPSSAMEPTLHCARPGSGCTAAANDRVVVEEPVRDVKRGDILVFDVPDRARLACGVGGKFIKRVIGLPGEVWQERGGYVYIDGKKLDEPYIKRDRRDFQTYPARKVSPDNYFMMGDNRQSSCDSRRWGTVPTVNLVGKVTQIQRPG